MSDILCTICARGGSKGVKNKNIREICGKPLIAHTVEQAIESEMFDHIVVSTDSDEIAEVASEHGAEVFFKRSAELSSDTSAKLDVIRDAFIRSEEHYGKKYSYLVDLDATSPLRLVSDITGAYRQMIYNMNTNLVTAMPARRSPYFNQVELIEGKVKLSKELENLIVRRQDAPKVYDMNASIYIWQRGAILNQEKLFDSGTGLYVMPEERSIDIDSELDFLMVQFLMERRNQVC